MTVKDSYLCCLVCGGGGGGDHKCCHVTILVCNSNIVPGTNKLHIINSFGVIVTKE